MGGYNGMGCTVVVCGCARVCVNMYKRVHVRVTLVCLGVCACVFMYLCTCGDECAYGWLAGLLDC